MLAFVGVVSWHNPAAKHPFELVQLAEFIGQKRFRPVMRNQHLQFGAGVDAPGIGPCLHEGRFSVLRVA